MTASENAINLIKEFEGCRLTAYPDGNGWSIGYGSKTSYEGQVIDQATADVYLLRDINMVTIELSTLLTRELDQAEFDAITALCFNVGSGRLAKSETLKLVNANQDPTKEWLGFDLEGGVQVPGLLRRRKAELALYFSL